MSTHSSSPSTDEFYWKICYSHYLYPALIAILESNIIGFISDSKTSARSLALRSGLSLDGVIALIPALGYFDIAHSNAICEVWLSQFGQSRKPRHWSAMISRHIEEDPHIRRLLKRFFDRNQGVPTEFWNKVRSTSSSRQRFYDSVNAHTLGTVPRIIQELELSGVDSLLDIGGGSGTISIAAVRADSEIRCTVLDFPEVTAHVSNARSDLTSFGDRLRFYPADARFRKWPSARVYLMSHFLQDFGFTDRKKLLQKVVNHLDEGASLWVHGVFDKAQQPTSTAAAFSFYLYCMLGGGVLSEERQIEECVSVGLCLRKVLATSPTHKLLIFENAR